jgi:hypothetical protein
MDDTKEIVINIKSQLEGAKEKEALKIQLTKKEETCHMLQMEVINLKKKNEKTKSIFKFHNSSVILDRIWNSEIQLMTKSVLDTIRKENVENGAPFKNMIKDHIPQKKKVQS